MNVLDDRLERLEAALERQELEIAGLRSQLANATATSSPAASPAGVRSTRRAMLVGGAVAAGAAVAGAVARPGTVAATDGSSMLVGEWNESAAGNTRIRSSSTSALNGVNIFTVTDNLASSTYEAAIGAVAQGVRVTNGVYAYTSSRATSTQTGHAIVARRQTGGRSNIFMPPSSSPPTGDSFSHAAGELRVDYNGVLWYCTNSGTPGRWVELAGPKSTGAVHAVTPTRVYDSRFADGPLVTDFNRVVSIATSIDVDTGAAVDPNFVPPGATAIMFNLTITQTLGFGYVFLGPGDATEVTSSTANWAAGAVTVANASLSTVDTSRQVKVFAGGVGSTHFIIDVTGYLL